MLIMHTARMIKEDLKEIFSIQMNKINYEIYLYNTKKYVKYIQIEKILNFFIQIEETL